MYSTFHLKGYECLPEILNKLKDGENKEGEINEGNNYRRPLLLPSLGGKFALTAEKIFSQIELLLLLTDLLDSHHKCGLFDSNQKHNFSFFQHPHFCDSYDVPATNSVM